MKNTRLHARLRRPSPVLGFLTCLLLALLPAFAQGTGTLNGVVLDASGKYLEGAEVTIAGTAPVSYTHLTLPTILLV